MIPIVSSIFFFSQDRGRLYTAVARPKIFSARYYYHDNKTRFSIYFVIDYISIFMLIFSPQLLPMQPNTAAPLTVFLR